MENPLSPTRPGSSPSRPQSRSSNKTNRPAPRKQVTFRAESVRSSQTLNEPQSTSNGGTNGHLKRGKSVEFVKDENSNEASPLLARRGEDPSRHSLMSPNSEETWNEEEDDSQETKSTLYLMLLTLSIGGLQIAWSVELSNGSPYLLGLGISKSLLAFVWIAGPLSGTLVQPYVGIKSDRCRSRFGKRRPFMIGGAVATVIALMALAWTRELISGIYGLFGVPGDAKAVSLTSIVFAVLMIYILDFAINVIQAAIRAFIVDCAPTHQQDSANAWASRMSGVGNIIGYLFGYVDLPRHFWFLGDTQFKVLCVIASLAMAITLGISCLSVKERDPRLEGEPGEQEGGVFSFFTGLFHSMQKLPTQIARVCQVQFFAWIGWFPFLFYITTYVGQIYVNPYFERDPNMPPEEVDELWERATRQGTFALLIFALTTFASSVILPFIITSSYKAPDPDEEEEDGPQTPYTPGAMTPGAMTPGGTTARAYRLPRTPITPHTPGGGSVGGYFPSAPRTPITPHTPGSATPGGYFPRTRTPIAPRTPATPVTPHAPGSSSAGGYFSIPRTPREPPQPEVVTKKDEQKTKSVFRYCTPFSVEIPWLTLPRAWLLSHILFFLLTWLTFVVRDTTGATVLVALIGIPWAMTNWAPFALIAAEISKRDSIRRGQIPPPPTEEGQALAEGEDTAEGADQAGVVLGIHNVAIAAPQVIATLVSSAIFRAFQKPRGVPGDESVAWVLRFGGLAALIAAWLTRRVKED